jgi:integrase
MNNFILIKGNTISKGMILINKETKTPYEAFSKYISILSDKGLANNTIHTYGDHVAAFLDFMFEIQLQPIESTNSVDSSSIFNLYYQLLAFGENADNPLIVNIAKSLNKKNTVANSIISGQITSALDYFIHHLEVDSDNGFLDQFRLERHITPQQENKIAKSSWLHQVIRKTNIAHPRAFSRKKTILFPRAVKARNLSSDSTDTYENALPSSLTFEFLLKQKQSLDEKMTLTKSRSYLLDSLLAASGVRVSEGMQVLTEDIDIKNNKIKIVSIDDRAYKGLTELEHESLVFKGRQTEKTFLIEPFASLFWDALKIYLENYYKRNMSHGFLFQKANGRPFFPSDESERCKTFKKRLKLHLGEDIAKKYTTHSLRHMYGVYMYNHIPIHNEKGEPTGKYGFPMPYVKILMGHSSIGSTQKYAKKDTSVTDVLITLANNKIKYSGLTLKNIIMDVKTKKLEEFRQEFERLESGEIQNA